MKFISYKCEFFGKINDIHILINEKSNREILGFFKISRDKSRPKIEPGSRELNPSYTLLHTEKSCRNLIKSNRNQIVFTMHRLIWNQTYFGLVPNQLENGNYNLIWV